jgi:predicted DNA-binding transcriptional regulator AlpA
VFKSRRVQQAKVRSEHFGAKKMTVINKHTGIPSALENFDALPDSAFVRLPIVCAIFGGRSAASVYRDVQAGRLPPPVSLGPRCSGWSVGGLRNARSKLFITDAGSTKSMMQATTASKASVAKRRANLAEFAGQA